MPIAWLRGQKSLAANIMIGLLILLMLSYIVMLSLYAYAFGSYGAALFPAAAQPLAKHLLISASLLAITVLNLLSARLIGKAEDWIVLVKLVILLRAWQLSRGHLPWLSLQGG